MVPVLSGAKLNLEIVKEKKEEKCNACEDQWERRREEEEKEGERD